MVFVSLNHLVPRLGVIAGAYNSREVELTIDGEKQPLYLESVLLLTVRFTAFHDSFVHRYSSSFAEGKDTSRVCDDHIA
jgi:hypothetical protein